MYLEIDNRMCAEDCFPSAESAADYLGALSAAEMLRFPYPLKSVRGEWGYLKNTKWTIKDYELQIFDNYFVFSSQVKR